MIYRIRYLYKTIWMDTFGAHECIDANNESDAIDIFKRNHDTDTSFVEITGVEIATIIKYHELTTEQRRKTYELYLEINEITEEDIDYISFEEYDDYEMCECNEFYADTLEYVE